MTRPSAATASAVIAAILLAIAAGQYLGLFSLFQPSRDPVTWVDIESVHFGTIYRAAYYQPARIPVDRSFPTDVKPDMVLPRPWGVGPSRWESKVDYGNKFVSFLVDPDEDTVGAPNLLITVKVVSEKAAFHPVKLVTYEIRVSVFYDPNKEYAEGGGKYENTYFTVRFKPYYKLLGLVAPDALSCGEYPSTGEVACVIPVAYRAPEEMPYKADILGAVAGVFGLGPSQVGFTNVYQATIEVDTSVVVTGARTTLEPGETLTPPPVTSTPGVPPPETVVVTKVIEATTTKTVTSWKLIYQTVYNGRTYTVTQWVTQPFTYTATYESTAEATVTRWATVTETVTMLVNGTRPGPVECLYYSEDGRCMLETGHAVIAAAVALILFSMTSFYVGARRGRGRR